MASVHQIVLNSLGSYVKHISSISLLFNPNMYIRLTTFSEVLLDLMICVRQTSASNILRNYFISRRTGTK